MRAVIIANGLVAATLLAGCAAKSPQSLMVVSVDADAALADVATLHVRATVADQTREFDVHPTGAATLSIPPAQTFGIDLPRSMSGTLALHVDARDSSDAVVASGDGSGPIHVGARADLALTLAAATNGADMGDDGGMPEASDMARPPGDMVVVPPAMLTIDKTTQSFGDITVGKTSTTASFLVINEGGMPSSVAMLTKGGANVGEFNIDTDCGPSLAPGGRCHVTATVSPTSAGMKSASFTLAAAQGGSVGGTLTANALTPGAVKILQASGDCGSSLIGTQSTTTASFTVQNSGATATSALSVTMSDPQFTASGCIGVTLAANATCTVTVKFKPSSSGTQNASLAVSATMGGTDTASVVGVGLKPAALKLSPTSYAFATTARGSSGETATFTVTNDGDVASPTLSLPTITGTNMSSFMVTSDGCSGKQIGASPDSCAIKVQFTPQLTDSNSAILNINTTTSGTVISAPLTGSGAPAWQQEAVGLTLQPLNAVWAADANNVYAVGDNGTIVYRDPTGKWSTRTLSASTPLPSLRSVSGSSSTDVYVAGSGIFESSNSSTWTSWEAGSYSGLIVFGPVDIWGSYYTGTGASAQSALYRFSSSTGWTQVKNSDGSAAIGLNSVWGTSSSDVYTYGSQLQCAFGSCSSQAVIVHQDASGNWTRQYNVNAPNPTAAIEAIFGFGSPANNLYAVTTVGTQFLHSTGNGTWTDVTNAPKLSCDAIWGASSTNIWFGCYGGLVAFDGTTWSAPTLTTVNVHGLYGTGAGNIYAVGDDGNSNGVIYHYY